MTIRHLNIFLAVCDSGGITAASKRLFISQPSVSAAISDIETEYGVRLFDRISRKLYLTETGRQLLEQARYLVNRFDAMESGLRGMGEHGILRVGASITIGNRFLPDFVKRFGANHTAIRVQAAINSSEQLERMLLDNELDLALIEGVPHHKKIVSRVFMKDELVVVCAPYHPLADGGRITLDQIAASDLILREKGSGTRELFDLTMALHGIQPEPLWESVSTQAIVRAVHAGLGLSVLPYLLVSEELEAHTLVLLQIEDVGFQRNYHIIHHADKYITPAMLDFIEVCGGAQ